MDFGTNARGVILGIHGLENKPPVDEKRRWWTSAIVEGLRRNGARADDQLPFEFVYWADLRYDAPVAADENEEPYYPDPGIGPFPRPDPAEGPSVNTMMEGVYKGLDWVQTTTRTTPVDDLILKARFDDLWHYHSETRFARMVRERLSERLRALSGRPILLVAHSMGSIIAYDVLRMLEREAPSVRVRDFVTLGSPLGLAEVKLKIAAENGAARTPNNVDRWTNLADRRDVATVAGDLAGDYAPNDHGVRVRDRAVMNEYRRRSGEPNHHKSYGYLRTPEFSDIAAQYLGPCPSASDRARP
ncbi:hypothetical protein [uncultured Methylobacterium sp.]|uniref:lipase/acyltransferase domain-containing protein n=1 Tax=uncultured Methylobacterium sp. TaxID=157278 RepID=UPI0035C9E800